MGPARDPTPIRVFELPPYLVDGGPVLSPAQEHLALGVVLVATERAWAPTTTAEDLGVGALVPLPDYDLWKLVVQAEQLAAAADVGGDAHPPIRTTR